MTKPDIHIIQQFRAGSISAFEEIIQLENARMLNFIRRYVRKVEQADDIFQEACIRLWRFRDRLRQPESLRAWIYQVTRSEIYDYLRKHDWSVEIVCFGEDLDSIPIEDRAPDPRDQYGKQQLQALLNKEVEKLDKQTREIVALKFASGLSFTEIAEALNIPRGTVSSKMTKALTDLRKSLAKMGLNFEMLSTEST